MYELTQADVAVIGMARKALEAPRGHADTAYEGRIAEAVERAAEALFHVLNVAHSYGEMNLTYEQLHGRPDPLEQAVEETP